jgi:ribose transport system permease protein
MKKQLADKSSIDIKEFLRKPEVNVLIALLAISLYLTIVSPYFFTLRNIVNVFRQSSVIAILALGQAMVIIAGGIDLSLGSLIGLTATFGAWLAREGAPPLLTLIAILGSGGMVGLLNGLMVTKIGLPPFIATMGMMSILKGFSLLITMGVPIRYEDTWISFFGGGKIGIIPFSVIIMIVMVLLVGFFVKNTTFGRDIYAIGNNEKAAKLSGIQVDTIRIMVFTLTGLFSGMCGLILMGQLGGSDAFYGNGYELDVIAAAVIGGISMTGGEGNVLGVVVGSVLMAVLKNGFVLLAVPGYWQTVAVGVVIIAAVSIDSLRRKSSAK